MGFWDALTGWTHGDQAVVVPTGTVQTGNGASAPISTAQYGTARLTLSVAAASGTSPSMTVTIQTSHDGTTWVNVGAFAARTAAGSERKVFTGLDNYVRASWAITGTTPSFTFGVSGAVL